MGKLTYILVPLWQGAERCGVEKGPQALMDAGVERIAQKYFETDYVALPTITEDVTISNKYRVLSEYLTKLKHEVSKCFTKGTLPFTIGGDHALGLGTVAAVAERYENIGLIWFDAHGDMNTEATSPTGHIHGMPTAALMGLCQSELNIVATKRVKPENIFWIGTRSLDAGERALIEQLHLHIYTTDYVRSVGMKKVMEEVQAEIQRLHIRHLHCSIDIDAMDPSIAGATGVAVPNGLNTNEYNLFIEELTHLPISLTSLDFVEYNPLLDDADRHTRTWCLQAIKQLMKAISE